MFVIGWAILHRVTHPEDYGGGGGGGEDGRELEQCVNQQMDEGRDSEAALYIRGG